MEAWFARLRISFLALTGVTGLLWGSSYLVGVQRYQSNWSTSGSSTSEKASWLVSNYGSVGLAWRSQTSELEETAPSDESAWIRFDASPSALDNVHPEGFLAWHWIHREPTKSMTMGSMRSHYGHLYVPYWMAFLGFEGLAFIILARSRRSGSDSVVDKEVRRDTDETF